MAAAGALADAVREAVAAVVDPEYPELTIVDLGMLAGVEVSAEGRAAVAVLPTVLGCPALAVIEADIVAAALAVGATAAEVTFLTAPRWTPERISPQARAFLAREMTVAIRRRDGSLRCPVCGSAAVTPRSAFGPTLCRELWWCDECRNPVEVIRR